MEALVRELEARLLPEFEIEAKRLSDNFPRLVARASSGSFGPGKLSHHTFRIECHFTDAFNEDFESVSLDVSLNFLTPQPKIGADVCWSPSGDFETDLWPGWKTSEDLPNISAETLEVLFAGLPLLYGALTEAVERRKPRER